MGNDVEGVIVDHKRTQIQPCDIFDTILSEDSFNQFFISSHLVAQRLYPFHELGMGGFERLTALLGTCIENGTVGEDDAGRNEHAVAVGMHATIHA